VKVARETTASSRARWRVVGIQPFGGAFNLNVDFRSLVLDSSIQAAVNIDSGYKDRLLSLAIPTATFDA